MGSVEVSILVAYFLLILSVGWYKGKGETSVDAYMVGNRQVPWWAVLGSLVATEISAATYLSVPAVGFSENMTYLQFGIGSFFARIFVATVFIGAFFKADCLSIYEYLGKRFGGRTQYTASVYFLITRMLASGVRLMIAVTGFSVILGFPFGWSLILFGLVTLAYTFIGGIRSVIWTDCIQAIVFLGAGFAAVSWLVSTLGFTDLMEQASAANRMEIFRMLPAGSSPVDWINDSKWFVTAVLFGFASTVASLGTDQDMAQRLLSSKTAAQARRSVILSGFIAIPVAALFLFLGVALYAHFQINPDPEFPSKVIDGQLLPDPEKAFSHFMTTGIPVWLKGLLLTGVLAAAMSSLDSAMAALSSSAVRDLAQPLFRKSVSASGWLWVSRGFTVFFASVLMGIAWLLRDAASYLWLAFQITSLTYGSLLGVFLLGFWTKRGTDIGNLLGMLSGTLVASVGLALIKLGMLPLAWTWLILIGAATTFLMGFCYKNVPQDLFDSD
ncbi:MAG: sodium/solute symporter [Puniceicoccaceae bacterium]